MERTYGPLAFPFLKRFPGWIISAVRFVMAATPGTGVRSVNWLTILGEPYVQAMGGVNALRGMLLEGATLHEWDGGVLIQAGPEPDIGDVNMDIWPETYRHIAAMLRPLRFEDYRNSPMCLMKVPEPLDAFAETLAGCAALTGRISDV